MNNRLKEAAKIMRELLKDDGELPQERIFYNRTCAHCWVNLEESPHDEDCPVVRTKAWLGDGKPDDTLKSMPEIDSREYYIRALRDIESRLTYKTRPIVDFLNAHKEDVTPEVIEAWKWAVYGSAIHAQIALSGAGKSPQCPQCYGKGEWYSMSAQGNVHCQICKGTGALPPGEPPQTTYDNGELRKENR